jgi:trigger factor
MMVQLVSMKTSVKHLSDTRARVTIICDTTDLEAAEQVALKKLAKTTKVAGFRKGHAPLEVVAKHTDQNALAQETLERALSHAVADAFISNSLQALERPAVEIKKYVPGSELEFTAEADVLPKVVLGDHTKLKAAKPEIKVLASDINDVVERIRKGLATKESSTTPAVTGDEVVIDFVGSKDGVPFEGGKGDDYPLTLGSNSFIPGFEDALVGVAPGEKRSVPLVFPEDYHAKDLAGQSVIFEVTVKSVNKPILPALDDEFAAKAGPFTSIKDLRADIKAEITAQKKREATDALKDDLVQQLIAKSKVAVPAVLKDDQIRSIEQDLTQNLMYRGMTIEQYFAQQGYADRDAWANAEADKLAENRIKAGLVLAELSKKLKIEATADELAAQVASYKQQYANNPDMAKRFDEPEVQREVANRLITEKTVDALVAANAK